MESLQNMLCGGCLEPNQLSDFLKPQQEFLLSIHSHHRNIKPWQGAKWAREAQLVPKCKANAMRCCSTSGWFPPLCPPARSAARGWRDLLGTCAHAACCSSTLQVANKRLLLTLHEQDHTKHTSDGSPLCGCSPPVPGCAVCAWRNRSSRPWAATEGFFGSLDVFFWSSSALGSNRACSGFWAKLSVCVAWVV